MLIVWMLVVVASQCEDSLPKKCRSATLTSWQIGVDSRFNLAIVRCSASPD